MGSRFLWTVCFPSKDPLIKHIRNRADFMIRWSKTYPRLRRLQKKQIPYTLLDVILINTSDSNRAQWTNVHTIIIICPKNGKRRGKKCRLQSTTSSIIRSRHTIQSQQGPVRINWFYVCRHDDCSTNRVVVKETSIWIILATFWSLSILKLSSSICTHDTA